MIEILKILITPLKTSFKNSDQKIIFLRPTMGAQVTIVYWPGKCSVTNRVIMFKLELWEAGSGITGRFEHLEEMDEPDCIVAIFSNMDRQLGFIRIYV